MNIHGSRLFPDKYDKEGILFEPAHNKTIKITCAANEDRSAWASAQSDQSLLCAQWVAKDPSFLNADSEDSDQTGRMPRLIFHWVHMPYSRFCHALAHFIFCCF